MSNYILYGITLILLIISFYKDKKKTKMALKKSWKSFENILPEFLEVIMLVGVLLAALRGSDSVATVYCKVVTIISHLASVISIKKKGNDAFFS